MTADKLLNLPDYGTGQDLRVCMAHALSELEAKAARDVLGMVPADDAFKVFIDDVKTKVDTLTAVA